MERNDTPRIRRLCISVDLENYSKWDAEEQQEAQRGLRAVLTEACESTHLDLSSWSHQPAGDGELAVLPPGIDEGQAISDFVHSLNIALYRHNHRLNERATLRVRIAMHAGMTQVAGLGFAGQAPVLTSRLRDCPQVRQEMAAHPAAHFALVISQQLYDDHIGHAYPDFNAGSFQRIRVELPDKNFVADAWLYLPTGEQSRTAGGGRTSAESGEPPARTPNRRPSGGVHVSGQGRLTATNVAGRDLEIRS